MKTKMKFSIIIFITILTQSCSNQKTENDWSRDGLQDEVLSFSQFSYKAEDRFGKIEKGNRKNKYFWEKDLHNKYDDKGNKIECNEYNSDGSLDWKRTSKYDDKGNEIEWNAYNSDGSLDSKFTYKYEFDKKGNWIKRIDFENEIAEFILEREYEYYN